MKNLHKQGKAQEKEAKEGIGAEREREREMITGIIAREKRTPRNKGNRLRAP